MRPTCPMDVCSCPANCGLCSNHLSHTGLSNIIVTNRCDLTCWYCFFYVKKGLEGAYVYEPTTGPGPGDGPHPEGREASARQLGTDHRRRAHHKGRPADDYSDHEGGRHRPHPVEHQRDQPGARASDGPEAEGGRRVQPVHVIRRNVTQDQPQEPLGGALRARGVQEGRDRRRPRSDSHQGQSTTTSSARYSTSVTRTSTSSTQSTSSQCP